MASSEDRAPVAGDEVISLEAEPPGPEDLEIFIEPAEPPEPEETAPPAVEPVGKNEPDERGPAERRERGEPSVERTTPRLVVAVASGKGGVGKSLLSASMGIYLAQLGKHVVLVDASLGSGNLHTLLGMNEPEPCLHAFLNRDVAAMRQVVAGTPFRGLGLIPGRNNAFGVTNPKQAQKTRLLQNLRSLPADYVIVDLPSGTDFNTLDIFLAADLLVTITVPEPTAIESCFRLIKSAFLRRLRTQKGLQGLLDELRPGHCGIPTPLQLLELARERAPKLADSIHAAMNEFKPRLVVNKTRTRDDLELGPALAVSGRRHLGLPFDYLGYLDDDDVVWVTVRKRRPLLVEYPEAKVSKDIERVARRILSLESKERPECASAPKPMVRQNHYEILGLHPGATEEEVRRAQRRVRRVYSAASPAVYGIVPSAEVHEMLERIDAAQATLVDPEKRQVYDRELFGEAESPTLAAAEPIAQRPTPPPVQEGVLDAPEPKEVEPRPDMPELTDDTVYTGELLRHIRLARGLELSDIAERTKISKTYLRAIEEEDFISTPAPVYLRGFVKTLARDLRLEPEQVARTYMERYHAAAGG
jgi:flagellar biosynthesis protein FlhG